METSNGQIQEVWTFLENAAEGPLNRSQVFLYRGHRPSENPRFELLWFAFNTPDFNRFSVGFRTFPGLFYLGECQITTNARGATDSGVEVFTLAVKGLPRGTLGADSVAGATVQRLGSLKPSLPLKVAPYRGGLRYDDGHTKEFSFCELILESMEPLSEALPVELHPEGRSIATDQRFFTKKYPRGFDYTFTSTNLPKTDDPLVLAMFRAAYGPGRLAGPYAFWALMSAITIIAAIYVMFLRKS